MLPNQCRSDVECARRVRHGYCERIMSRLFAASDLFLSQQNTGAERATERLSLQTKTNDGVEEEKRRGGG
ncbi:hypothetical protein Trydic_g22278 [Trypoxylus dichotomus]